MLSWVFFAVIAAVLAGAASVVEKKDLTNHHAMEFSAAAALLMMLLTTPLWFFADLSSLEFTTILLIYAASLFATLGFLLIAKAMRHAAISYTAPFFALDPVILAILAAVILGEKISLLQLAGLIVIIIGAYVLKSHTHQDLLAPFRHFFRSKHVKYMLLAFVFYGLASIIDKKVVGAGSDSGFGVPVLGYVALVHFFIAMNFVILMLLFHDGFKGIGKSLRNDTLWMLFFAVLTLGYRFCQVFALSLPGVLVSLVIPIKRLSALFATVIGGEFFHEHHLVRKSVACAIMLIGAVLIML